MKYKSVLILNAVLFLLFSCSSYDEMVGKLDSKYAKETETSEENYSMLEAGFDAAKLIPLSSYVISTECIFMLVAPADADSYSWELRESLSAQGTVIGTSRTLTYSMPGSFSTSKDNVLVLTVTDSTGKEYTDSAIVLLR